MADSIRSAPQEPALGARLAALAATEFETLRAQLAEARGGHDRSVHQARKTLQRLRALVRLWAPLDPDEARRENKVLGRLRRRLGELRDAGARRELLRRLASRKRWAAHAEALRALADLDEASHRAAWRAHGADSPWWLELDRTREKASARVARWPTARMDGRALERALAKAWRRLQRDARAADGTNEREPRHELRRKLRHYANLRAAAAQVNGTTDAQVDELLDLARRLGSEGDLWLAAERARMEPQLDELVAALEAERRTRGARYDEAVRRVLAGEALQPP